MTDYKQLFFLDESWRNDKTVNKKRGRSKRGTRCKANVNFTRGNYKINLLLACNHVGPIAFDIWNSKIGPERFCDFLENKLTPLVNPYPGHNSVLVLDNYYTHESREVFRWCARNHVIPIHEPAHEPYVQLTEWNFNAIKMKEQAKGVSGEYRAVVLSLIDSIHDCVGLNWKSVMNKIGYINGITDSD